MASKQAIAAKISGLAMIYRPNMSAAECQVLCREYHESLLDLTDEQFLRGVVEAKKVCRFLPTPADIRQGYDNAPAWVASDKNPQAALPQLEINDDIWRQQQIMAKLFRRSLDGNMPAKEFFTGKLLQGSREWEEKAREVLGADYPEKAGADREDAAPSTVTPGAVMPGAVMPGAVTGAAARSGGNPCNDGNRRSEANTWSDEYTRSGGPEQGREPDQQRGRFHDSGQTRKDSGGLKQLNFQNFYPVTPGHVS